MDCLKLLPFAVEKNINPFKMKSCYDRRSVGQSLLVSSPFLGLMNTILLQLVVDFLISGAASD